MESLRCANCQSLPRRVRELQAEIERLRRQLDEATRAGKRQVAPFAKGQPKINPRKPGKDYGTKAHRQLSSPEQIDETHEETLPHVCADCGGPSTKPTSPSSSRSRFHASRFTGSSTFALASAVVGLIKQDGLSHGKVTRCPKDSFAIAPPLILCAS